MLDTTVWMRVVILVVSVCEKARSRGYHMERRIYIRLLHLLRTDHVSPYKFVDIVEVPGLRDSAVVIAVWQLFPHHDLGLAQAEELLHVAWSVDTLALGFPK